MLLTSAAAGLELWIATDADNHSRTELVRYERMRTGDP